MATPSTVSNGFPARTVLTVCTLIIALPVLSLPFLAAFPAENIWPHLVSTVLPGYVATTLRLMLGVGALTFLIGVATAWFVTMHRFPGQAFFRWALLLPLAMPAYVVAYVYTDLLEYAGPVQRGLRALAGWHSAREYSFPEIRSLGGAIVVMGLVFYPYVYLLARGAFLEQSVASLEASRTLGCSPWAAFRRVALPGARPAIAVGLSLVLMETLNDFGTVDFFGVNAMTAGVFDVWLNMDNLGGAAQLSLVMLIFVIALVTIERLSRRRQRHYTPRAVRRPAEPSRLRGWQAAGAFGLCAIPVGFGFFIPVAILARYALRNLPEAFDGAFVRHAANSFWLALGSAVLTLIVGMAYAYAMRLRPQPYIRCLARSASLGYAVPGAVLAIGVLVPFAAIDNSVDAAAREWLGVSTGLLLSGTPLAILFAYSVRFLTVSLGGIESSLAKVTPSMDMAARTLGLRPGQVFLRVHLPLIRVGMLAAGTIVFVDCMKELPATLLLRPFDFDTLATHLYQFASDEQIEQAALGALTIALVGLAPVVVLSRTMARRRRPGQPRPAAPSGELPAVA